ncbi:uncharacterized protein M421DRAFT_323617 [Didymella exigua CBS 183.55]|uniref:Transmembrane protein n=1 Tax=Didymella exigua CBS 183.55 TaxID=1150837 RepID=A0A6A5RY39_9PLEO|nr:uncharacterized protein M421DRAFT_323617 [Didymella exigua CBS 183.55]KAF1931938.1 hypothetical protein M421DRAFT_323617 [Didymella exigua CBS 183.55]
MRLGARGSRRPPSPPTPFPRETGQRLDSVAGGRARRCFPLFSFLFSLFSFFFSLFSLFFSLFSLLSSLFSFLSSLFSFLVRCGPQALPWGVAVLDDFWSAF